MPLLVTVKMSELTASVQDNRGDFWRRVSEELEAGLLCGWEDDCLVDSGPEVADDVQDIFLWDDEWNDDFVLYTIVNNEQEEVLSGDLLKGLECLPLL